MFLAMIALFIVGIVLLVLSGTKFKRYKNRFFSICSIAVGIVCLAGAVILALPHS